MSKDSNLLEQMKTMDATQLKDYKASAVLIGRIFSAVGIGSILAALIAATPVVSILAGVVAIWVAKSAVRADIMVQYIDQLK